MKTYALAERPLVGVGVARKLVPVIEAVKGEHYDVALAELVRLTGYREITRDGGSRILPCEPRTVGRGILTPAGAQPKPEGRIIDEDALDRFHEANPWCWVQGCPRRAGRPHHLRKRSDHGDDIDRNLFALCDGPDGHHRGNLGFHTVEPYGAGFYCAFYFRLSVEHRQRITLALPEIVPVVAQIFRGEIVLRPAAAQALVTLDDKEEGNHVAS